VVLAGAGFATTLIAIVLSVIPADEEPDKPLAVAKVLVSTAVLIGGGTLLFLIAERKRKALLAERGTQAASGSE